MKRIGFIVSEKSFEMRVDRRVLEKKSTAIVI